MLARNRENKGVFIFEEFNERSLSIPDGKKKFNHFKSIKPYEDYNRRVVTGPIGSIILYMNGFDTVDATHSSSTNVSE